MLIEGDGLLRIRKLVHNPGELFDMRGEYIYNSGVEMLSGIFSQEG